MVGTLGAMTSVTPESAIAVTLSTSSVYPLGPEAAFETAARLGYDGVEVMVLGDPLTHDVRLLRRWSEDYGVPVLSIHAPCLLVTQRVWGTSDPWTKLDRSIELAHEVDSEVVVVHPPFRWQRDYASAFVDGVAEREVSTDMRIAVENMFPWRARNTDVQAYLPAWDPVPQPYDSVTLDLSHTATAGSDALAMQAALGERLAQAIPRPDRSADVMQARWAYFFGPGCEPGLAEVARVLRPGGTAFVIDNDATTSTFGRWFRREHPRYDPAAIERFWARRGYRRERIAMRWSMHTRADFEAAVRIEFSPAVASAFLADHAGCEVDYAVNLWWSCLLYTSDAADE